MAAEVDEILHAADRAASLTRQLLAFSRKQVLQPIALDLNEIVSGVSRMARRLIGTDVQLRLELSRIASSQVLADPAQVEQVLLNLIVNARDAMPSGGTIVVTTGNVRARRRCAGDRPGRHRAGRVRDVAVSDDGIGMDQATQARIFEPFFTTKETGRGTGLGLSTVYGIVRQTGGAITVESERGKGATLQGVSAGRRRRIAVIRKPVVLITGAGGEIGHGLIAQLAADGRAAGRSRSTSTRSSRRSGKMVQREFTGSIMDKPLLERMLSEFEVDDGLPPRGAAVDAIGVHAGDGAPGQRRRHAEPARVLAARGRVARPAGDVSLSLVDRRLRAAGSRDQAARRQGEGRRLQHAVDDVRLQQAVLRATGPLLREVLQAAGRRVAVGPRRFPLRAVSRA